MPRPTTATNQTVLEAVPNESPVPAIQAEPKPKRQRRPIPEGVTVGLTGLRKAEPPARAGRGGRGRGVDPQTLEVVNALKEDSGEWYEIGVYSAPAVPTGVWDENDIIFQHSSRDDGFVTRYAKHDPDEAAENRQRREERKAQKESSLKAAKAVQSG